MRKLIPASLVTVTLLVGCAAPAPHYYSLQLPPSHNAGSGSAVNAAYAINVQPVSIPDEVARPQIVVRESPGAEVIPLNSALWAGPLDAQIRNVLAEALERRLNVLDVSQSGGVEGLPVWRIAVDVRRFDSVYGERVRHDLTWRLTSQGGRGKPRERVCSATADVSVDVGMAALVEGHRHALSGMAEVIAQTLPLRGAPRMPAADAIPANIDFRGCAG